MSRNPLSALIRIRHGQLGRDRKGGVTVIAALSLTSILGMTGLAMEVSQGYATKVANQRVADAAALAAAMAYSAASDNSVVQPTASAIAVANGLAASAVVAPTPTTDASSRKIITATVTTAVPLRLTRMITSALSYNVVSVGVAAVTPGSSSSAVPAASPCLMALSSTAANGIYMNGGTIINAACQVASNRAILVAEGAAMTAQKIVSGQSIGTTGGATITTSPTPNNKFANQASAASDPLIANPSVSAGVAKIGTYVTPAAITNPTTPAGSDWTFDWSGNPAVQAFKTSGGNYTVPAGTYTVGRMTIGGGVNVTFQGATNITIAGGLSNGGTVVLGNNGNWRINGGFDTGWSGFTFGSNNFHFGSGTITINGSSVAIGNGNIIFNGPLTVGGGTSLTFGNGSHSFSSITMNGNTLTFGDGDLNVTGTITTTGSSVTTFGTGNVTVGGLGGTSINVGGGGTLSFKEGNFSTAGAIQTGGGSTLNMGCYPGASGCTDTAPFIYQVNGALNIVGGARFGNGKWYVNGNLSNGTGCNPCTMASRESTFFLGGVVYLAGGSGLDLRALPTANITGAASEAVANLVIVSAPASYLSGGTCPAISTTKLDQGALVVFGGIFYAPCSDFQMIGGSKINNVTAPTTAPYCFALVANTVTLTGGTAANTQCDLPPGAAAATTTTPATVALIR